MERYQYEGREITYTKEPGTIARKFYDIRQRIRVVIAAMFSRHIFLITLPDDPTAPILEPKVIPMDTYFIGFVRTAEVPKFMTQVAASFTEALEAEIGLMAVNEMLSNTPTDGD